MNFRRKKRENVDITLISMIDVLFVLLLFFMISTTFNRHTEVKIELPEAAGPQAQAQPKTVTLTIDAQGVYSLTADDDQAHTLANQEKDTLRMALISLSEHTKGLPFIINADGKTPHQAVITALEVASEAGFTHITFAAEQAKSEQ